MNEHIIIIFIAVAMIGFAVSETIVVTAQQKQMNVSNYTNMDNQKIIVTWLKTNDTMTSETSVISVSSEDFWKIFEPLLELSTNGSTSASE
ncbi:MAG TPA: hypothetical protein VE548_11125 [Nitrososphaeraceae archaeon]|jgi:hypothetical protein|nr:hypothetical protein [Nitrososphaeraceae archaeon]